MPLAVPMAEEEIMGNPLKDQVKDVGDPGLGTDLMIKALMCEMCAVKLLKSLPPPGDF